MSSAARKSSTPVILDLGLPDMQGVDVLKRWRKGGRANAGPGS